MTWRARAHYDGEKLVLDEPVDLPVDVPLELDINLLSDSVEPNVPADERTLDDELAAIDRFTAMGVPGVIIPAEALRRENMYGDDGR
jgi:hypothetical protein